MAYGAITSVESLVCVYTTDGVFSATTQPTRSAVTNFLMQVSAMLDAALAGQGFAVPVTQPTAVVLLDAISEALTADLCHAANSSGRFFTNRALEAGVNPIMAVRTDVNNWVAQNISGLETLGVARALTVASNSPGWISPNRQR